MAYLEIVIIVKIPVQVRHDVFDNSSVGVIMICLQLRILSFQWLLEERIVTVGYCYWFQGSLAFPLSIFGFWSMASCCCCLLFLRAWYAVTVWVVSYRRYSPSHQNHRTLQISAPCLRCARSLDFSIGDFLDRLWAIPTCSGKRYLYYHLPSMPHASASCRVIGQICFELLCYEWTMMSRTNSII